MKYIVWESGLLANRCFSARKSRNCETLIEFNSTNYRRFNGFDRLLVQENPSVFCSFSSFVECARGGGEGGGEWRWCGVSVSL